MSTLIGISENLSGSAQAKLTYVIIKVLLNSDRISEAQAFAQECDQSDIAFSELAKHYLWQWEFKNASDAYQRIQSKDDRKHVLAQDPGLALINGIRDQSDELTCSRALEIFEDFPAVNDKQGVLLRDIAETMYDEGYMNSLNMLIDDPRFKDHRPMMLAGLRARVQAKLYFDHLSWMLEKLSDNQAEKDQILANLAKQVAENNNAFQVEHFPQSTFNQREYREKRESMDFAYGAADLIANQELKDKVIECLKSGELYKL